MPVQEPALGREGDRETVTSRKIKYWAEEVVQPAAIFGWFGLFGCVLLTFAIIPTGDPVGISIIVIGDLMLACLMLVMGMDAWEKRPR